MNLRVVGMFALTGLALGLLLLIGWTFQIIGAHIGPDGRVPSSEAFGLTALLLSFREVVASMRSIWDGAERARLTETLAASSPSVATPPDAKAAADDVAGAAVARADAISGS